ncbi:MAG: hypothetical protein KBS81_08355, partial [Spirochaetales bacterium]|nr:hypothetical protein [Candidatus Physcosoma equi]
MENTGRRRTFKEYRTLDLTIWAAMLVVFELLVVKAGTSWFRGQPYSVSLVPALTAVVFMRWGVFGLIHGALGGVVFAFASHTGVQQALVYALGNLLSGLVLLMFQMKKKEEIRTSNGLSVVFTLLVALLMQVGRGLMSLLFGGSVSGILDFVLTDVLSGVFAAVLVYVTMKMDGVFEDQKTYLFRINRKDEEEGED